MLEWVDGIDLKSMLRVHDQLKQRVSWGVVGVWIGAHRAVSNLRGHSRRDANASWASSATPRLLW